MGPHYDEVLALVAVAVVALQLDFCQVLLLVFAMGVIGAPCGWQSGLMMFDVEDDDSRRMGNFFEGGR